MYLFAFWAFFSILIASGIFLAVKIATTDMRRRIIPDSYLFPLLIIGFLVATFFPWVCNIQEAVIGMAFGYLLSTIVGFGFDYFLTKRNPNAETPIGMGDIKLIATGGLWSGPSCLALALVLACIFGGIWSHTKKQKFIPFAPFFIAGEFLSLIIFAFLI